MTRRQRGDAAEAQRLLKRVGWTLDGVAADRPPVGTLTLLEWHERLELRLLREEAISLLAPKL